MMHILKIRERGGDLHSRSSPAILGLEEDIYMYGYWEIYVCCWGDGRAEERGGLKIENGNG